MGKDFERSVKRLQERVRTEPDVMVRVLRVIWDRQSAREKYYKRHDPGHDHKGFSEEHTPFCCELHDKLEDVGFRWQKLQAVDLARGQKIVAHYARQYLKFQKQRREQELEESREFVERAREEKQRRANERAKARWGDAAIVWPTKGRAS